MFSYILYNGFLLNFMLFFVLQIGFTLEFGWAAI